MALQGVLRNAMQNIADSIKSSVQETTNTIKENKAANSAAPIDEQQIRETVRQQLSPVNNLNERIEEAKRDENFETPQLLGIQANQAERSGDAEQQEEEQERSKLMPSFGQVRMGNDIPLSQIEEPEERGYEQYPFQTAFNMAKEMTQPLVDSFSMDPLREEMQRDSLPSISDQETLDKFDSLIAQRKQEEGEPQFENIFDQYIKTSVDDGTLDEEAFEAPDMTGAQYKWYRQFMGTGGRPLEEIDDNAIYNKAEEFRNYGFQPVVRNQDQMNRMVFDNMTTRTGTNFNNWLSDLRENARNDYSINNIVQSDGSVIDQINGDYFDSYLQDYMNDLQNMKAPPSDILFGDDVTEDIINDPNYLKKYISKWTVKYDDGTEEVYEGGKSIEIDEDDAALLIQTGDKFNIPVHVGVMDANGEQIGSTIVFDNYQELQDALGNGTLIPTYDESEDYEATGVDVAIPVNPMVLDDGTEIPYQTAVGIERGQLGTPDYGTFNLDKPAAKTNDFITWDDEGKKFDFDFTDIVPNMMDIALGSAPYMAPMQIMAPLMGANVMQGLKGIDSMSGDVENGTYQRVAEDLNNERYFSNLAGEIAIPLSEHFMGVGAGAGGNFFAKTFAPKLYQRMQNATAKPLLDIGRSTIGEGLEEVGQAPIEETKRYGISGAFADQIYDEGIPQYDATGHEVRDVATDLATRLANFVTGVPNEALAGSIMGGGFNAPRIPAASYNTRQRYKRNKRDKELGLPRWRES